MTAPSFFIALIVLFAPSAAHAYIGPGAGITAIGSLLTLIAATLLAIVGFVWYPLKRLLKSRRRAAPPIAEANDGKSA